MKKCLNKNKLILGYLFIEGYQILNFIHDKGIPISDKKSILVSITSLFN